MSNVIYRYRLGIVDTPFVYLPEGAEVLSFGPPRDGGGELDMWAVVDPDETTMVRHDYRVVGTGHPIPEDVGGFVATVPTHNGQLIWHVFWALSAGA